MALTLTDEIKQVLCIGADLLKGAARRLFMASVVARMGRGGQRKAESELHWNRDVIRKGMHELKSGIQCLDGFSARGRKRLEELNPDLEKDLREIAESFSQTDPTFRTIKKYRRLTANEVRRQLSKNKGYTPERLPSERTIRRKLNDMGFYPRRVAKSRPLKKIKQTNAIFDQVHLVNKQADADDGTVRLSIDTKAVVAIGDLSRGGKSRQGEQASDHDFQPETKLTPFGLFRPDTNETWLYFTSGAVTADFMVDKIQEIWPELKKKGNSPHTLVINADNGPENSGIRSQWLKRLVEFSAQRNTTVQLAYYPPYHSKYNPIERVFGVLENYWNGDPLRTVEKALGMAESMTYNGIHPIVKLVEEKYEKGVKLSKKVRIIYEKAMKRLAGLEKWFITIKPKKAKKIFPLLE